MACSSRFARCRIATSSSVKGGGHHSPSWSSSKLWLLCLLSFCPCMAKMLTITYAWWEKSYECLQPNVWQYTLDDLTMVETLLDTRDAPYKFHTVHRLFKFVGLRRSWKAKWTFKPTILQIFGTMFACHILVRMTKDTPRHKCAELWAKQSMLSADWWRQRVKVDKQTNKQSGFRHLLANLQHWITGRQMSSVALITPNHSNLDGACQCGRAQY